MPILATSRTIEGSSGYDSDMVTLLNADVATEEGILKIVAAMEGKQVMYLFNNAGYFSMQSTWGSYEAVEFDSTMDINVKAPLFLASRLTYAHNARILNIGSHAGFGYRTGNAYYCISKAALKMVNTVINAHLNEQSVYSCYLLPGATDTEMLHKTGLIAKMSSPPHGPEVAAKFCLWLTKDSIDNSEFATKYWDIWDETLHPQWVEEGMEPPKYTLSLPLPELK